MFNIHYFNIAEKALGVSLENYVTDTNNGQVIIEGVIRKYERHPSILKIKNNFVSSTTFHFPKAEVADWPNFGPILRGQPHSPDVNHCIFTCSTRRSPGAL